MKTKILGIALCLTVVSLSTTTKAQPIPATIPDSIAGAGSNVSNINCDALELSIGGNKYTLSTVVWDNVTNGPTESVTVQVQFKGANVSGSGTRRAIIPKAKRPDVMIGHTANGYYIGVIYEISGAIELRVYEANITPTPSIGLNLVLLTTQVLESNPSEWPHIDGFTDANTIINGTPAIPEFAACWQLTYFIGSNNAKAVTGNIEPPVTTSLINWIYYNSMARSDISAYTDVATGDKYAAYVWMEDLGSSVRNTVIIGRGPVPGTTSSRLEWVPEGLNNFIPLGTPRIESQSQYDNTSGNPEWVMVCPKWNGTSFDINEYNSLSCIFCPAAQTISTSFSTTNSYTATAISAGTGMSSTLGGTGKYNSLYQSIMHAPGTTIVNAANIAATGGSLVMPLFDVNTTALPSPPLAFTTPVAASSTSNTGNYMMAAWWDGTNVKYKLVYDSTGFGPHYRSTGIDNVAPNSEVAIYPNPAGIQLTISGINEASYIITDIGGRTVALGTQKEKQPIDISTIAPGSYFIELTKSNKRHMLRFTKN